jgi:hypothetical protein
VFDIGIVDNDFIWLGLIWFALASM